MLLNASSPKHHQTHGKVSLKDHQLAMLHRCTTIEKHGKAFLRGSVLQKVGIMSDSPGSGKTYVILSLILSSPLDTVNIIVVPQNIYTQWEQAIVTFCGNDMDYARFVSYADVSSLYYKPSSVQARIVLTTPLYFNVIVDSLQGNCSKIHRVFIDEIDSVQHLLRYNDVFSMLWFVSASFSKSIMPSIGFHGVSQERDLADVTCRCEEGFIKQGFALPDPVHHTTICLNALLDHVLNGVVSSEEYRMLNALDYGAIKLVNIVGTATSITDAVALFVKDLMHMREGLLTTCDDLGKTLANFVGNADDLEKLQHQRQAAEDSLTDVQSRIACIQKRMEECDMCNICYNEIEDKVVTACCQNSFCEACLTTWSQAKTHNNNSPSCPTCRHQGINIMKIECPSVSQVVEATESISIDERSSDTGQCERTKSKLEELEDMLNSKLGNKIIIFADYTSIFKEIARMLERLDVSYVELDGGSIQAIDTVVENYKQGSVRVMMTNSSLNGCGMNLENSSDVVLLHGVNPVLADQVIGRAQRPGRTQALHVWHLLHSNEAVQTA